MCENGGVGVKTRGRGEWTLASWQEEYSVVRVCMGEVCRMSLQGLGASSCHKQGSSWPFQLAVTQKVLAILVTHRAVLSLKKCHLDLAISPGH